MTSRPYKTGDYIDFAEFQDAVIAALSSLGFVPIMTCEKKVAFIGSGIEHPYEKWTFQFVDKAKGEN